MRVVVVVAVVAVVVFAVATAAAAQNWQTPQGAQSGPMSGPQRARGGTGDLITERFAAPTGFTRVDVATSSFGGWLRTRTVLPASVPVRRFDGEPVKAPWSLGVVELDIGDKDLQQCADSAIRLYADWHKASGTLARATFHATSGDEIPWSRYARGERAFARGNKLGWRDRQTMADANTTEQVYRAWLDDVFMYAGSMSLGTDTTSVAGPLLPGDLLVQPGSPGHVLVVMDVAEDADRSHQQLLLAQGFMPAQSFHVIGWFAPDADGAVLVPSWPRAFDKQSRRRFR